MKNKETKYWIFAAIVVGFLVWPPAHAAAPSGTHFGNASCSVTFQPGDTTLDKIASDISTAKHWIRLAAYGFSYKPIADALVAAHNRGVDVQVVLDKSNLTASYSLLPELVKAGIPTYIDSKHAIMHNKFIVMDGFVVETGSINFTYSGENRNAENSLICHTTAGAAAYDEEWDILQKESVKQ